MALDQLRLYRDIAQTRSFSKGARLNGVSQSAASQQIQEIERRFGIPFFDRSTRPLVVTEAGRLYLDYCRDLLRRQEDFEAELGKLKKEVEGMVRVAAIYSVGLSEMSEIEEAFSARFPAGELEVEYLRPEKVYQAVFNDHADIGLLSYAESTREVVALPWREEEMVIAVSPDHRFAGRGEIAINELNGEEFVGFDEDLPIRENIDRYLREHRVEVETVLHFDNLQMIKEAVTHGSGISILPLRILQREIEEERIVPIPLNPNDLFRPIKIIHRRRKVFSDLAQGLLDLLRGK